MAQELWSAESEEYLKHLWFLESGKQIGVRLGVSKNAAIGKGHRMGLPPKGRPVTRCRSKRPPKLKKKIIKVKARPKGLALVPLIELKDSQCHWPFGDPSEPDYGYCGQEVCEKHPSYCDEHRALGTIKNTKKRKPRG